MLTPFLYRKHVCRHLSFNCSDLSTYRSQLMGIATLMIIICHSCASKVIMPDSLCYLFCFGNIGVDIFLFLSGIGLYYSLSKNNLSNKENDISFYKKRFYRIYIPYLMVFIPSCLIFMLLGEYSLYDSILCLSTLEYWLFRRGAWFVSLIVLLYLVAPFLYRALNGEHKWIIAMAIVIALMILSNIPIEDQSSTSVPYNIQRAFSRTPSFIVGLTIGRSCKEGKQLTVTKMAIFIFVSIISSIILGFWKCLWLIVPILLYILTPLIRWSKGSWVDKSLHFLGKISLESYLTNITLNGILIVLIPAYITSPILYGRYIEYTIVVVAGILLAFIINNAAQRVINKKLSCTHDPNMI